jgi:hypothetical protein
MVRWACAHCGTRQRDRGHRALPRLVIARHLQTVENRRRRNPQPGVPSAHSASLARAARMLVLSEKQVSVVRREQ